jgi:hypothetical protein
MVTLTAFGGGSAWSIRANVANYIFTVRCQYIDVLLQKKDIPDNFAMKLE